MLINVTPNEVKEHFYFEVSLDESTEAVTK